MTNVYYFYVRVSLSSLEMGQYRVNCKTERNAMRNCRRRVEGRVLVEHHYFVRYGYKSIAL